MRALIIMSLFTILLLQACNSHSSQTNTDSSVDKTPTINKSTIKADSVAAFKSFLRKFKVLQLPLDLQTLKIDIEQQQKLTLVDNAFIRSQYPNELYSYGMLPDTTDSYKLIWLEPTEIEIPILATFTKNGEFIKKEELGVGQCGSDCCFECNEIIKIDKALNILSIDSIKSYKCDTNGPIANTTINYILSKTAKISSNGNFKMSEVVKLMIEN